VTRKLNKISPNFWKKWPKISKILHQNEFESPKLPHPTPTTNHVRKLFAKVKIGRVESSAKGRIFAQSGHTDWWHKTMFNQTNLKFPFL
jgi:hypothetical protein